MGMQNVSSSKLYYFTLPFKNLCNKNKSKANPHHPKLFCAFVSTKFLIKNHSVLI